MIVHQQVLKVQKKGGKKMEITLNSELLLLVKALSKLWNVPERDILISLKEKITLFAIKQIDDWITSFEK